MLGVPGRFRGSGLRFLGYTGAEWWCTGDGEVEDKPVGEPTARTWEPEGGGGIWGQM